MQTDPPDEVTTREALDILGYADASSISRMVQTGRLVPSRKLAQNTGAFLFRRADVVALADERRAKIAARLAAMESAAS